MRIAELLKTDARFVSMEFFPPKEEAKLPDFFSVVEKLQPMEPLFVSVTYGAGGSTQKNTLNLVQQLKRQFGLEPMAHLTCVGASEPSIAAFVDSLQKESIDNILALRGDPPKGQENFVPDSDDFQYACDLVRFIKKNFPEMGLGVAGYPEKHPEAPSMDADCRHLKAKLDLSADFVITQMFFNNDHYFNFVDTMRAMGVTKPILPGVLPILSVASIKRIASLCGAQVPGDFMEQLEEADARGPEAVQELGIAYARQQVCGLLENGAPGVHLYTLNRADACLKILADPQVKQLLKANGAG